MIKKLLLMFFCLFFVALMIIRWGLEEYPNPQGEIKKRLETEGSYSFTDNNLEQLCYIPYYGSLVPLRSLVGGLDFFLVKMAFNGLSENVGDTSWWIVKIEKNNKVKIIRVKNELYPKITHTICSSQKKIIRSYAEEQLKQNKIYFHIENSGFSSHPQQSTN